MTRAKEKAYRFRRTILIVGVLYLLAAIAWAVLPLTPFFDKCDAEKSIFPMGLLYTPLTPNGGSGEGLYAGAVIVLVALLFIAQWTFLRPRGAWMARLSTEGKPLKSAIIVAAAMAMLLSLGVFSLVCEILSKERWSNWMDKEYNTIWPIMYLSMVLMWIVWALIFGAYWRQGDRYTQLWRMIRALIAGSFLEAFVAVPVHVAVTRQRECYCSRGTYTTLVCAGTVLFWAFGPGIVMLYAREKYRQAKLFPRCPKCDYDLRGNESGVCPECGTKQTSTTQSPELPTS
ncbi:MAG: hypothetical protein HY287_01015 [Planctomycetes bacterium]|nr:hypothetical protein [Planctomycetota bacterium]